MRLSFNQEAALGAMMSDNDIRERLSRLEHGQDALRGDVGSLRGEVTAMRGEMTSMRNGMNALHGEMGSLRGEVNSLRGEVTEIKTILSHLMPMIVRIDERLSAMPSPAEFYELRGRVEEISRRQPTTLGYTPPSGRTAQG